MPEGDCIVHDKDEAKAAVLPPEINKVFICTGDIFDENNDDENSFIYRLTNTLHIKTKHKYIYEQLLFEPGDRFNQRILEESERNIRSNNYISKVSVDSQTNKDNPDSHDVIVRTRDAWTTEPTLSFSRSGGVSTSSIGLREDNLLGQGIRLSVKQKKDVERKSMEFKYFDDTALGSDKSLFMEYSHNSDGDVKGFQLAKPYRSLNDNISYGIDYRDEILIKDYYVLGEESLSFTNFNKESDVYFSVSSGFFEGKTHRHQFGVQNIKMNLSEVQEIGENPSPVNVLNATNASIYTPYYQYQFIEDKFVKKYNVYTIGRDEDINYGLEFRARIGVTSFSYNSDDEQLLHELSFSKIFTILNDADLTVSGGANFLFDSSRPNQLRSNLDIDYFKSQSHNFKFFSSLSTEYGHNLRNGEQIYLDNLNGLRGYPLYHLSGTKSALFTMEERVYFDKTFWSIINVGAAIFMDVGTIKGEAELDKLDIDYFRSAGIGLRLTSNRSSSTNILHIDFTKPLDAHSGSRDFQIAIEVKDSF